MTPPIALFAVGLGVGFLVGLTSMGGATLMTPFLILTLGMRPHLAIGTDIAYAAITKIAGALFHWRQGQVDMRIVRAMAIASVPAGIAGALASYAVGGLQPAGDRYLRNAIGIILVAVTILLLFRGRSNHGHAARWKDSRRRNLATTGWGGVTGVIVGFTSMGSGTLVLPFLIWAYDAPAAKLVGTDVFHAAVLLTTTGGLFASIGGVEWDLLPWLLAGSLPGVALGSRVASRAPETALRLLLVVVLLASAWKLIG